jgi:hypothetical protein
MAAAINQTAAAVLTFVRRNPGVTCQQIAAGIGERPGIVRVELAELREAGRLESAGNTRGTRWRVVAKGSK